jgi:hypothetical protein
MTVPQILAYVNQMIIDWGMLPYIQAAMLLLIVVGTIVLIRRLFLGS